MPFPRTVILALLLAVVCLPLPFVSGSTASAMVENALPQFQNVLAFTDDSPAVGFQVARPSIGNKSITLSFNVSDANGYAEINQSTGRCELTNASQANELPTIYSSSNITWGRCWTTECEGICMINISSNLRLGNYVLNASVNESNTSRSAFINTSFELTGTSFCGDGICDPGEYESTCPDECSGVVPTPTPTPTPTPEPTISPNPTGQPTGGTPGSNGAVVPVPPEKEADFTVEHPSGYVWNILIRRAPAKSRLYVEIREAVEGGPRLSSVSLFVENLQQDANVTLEQVFDYSLLPPDDSKNVLVLFKTTLSNTNYADFGNVETRIRVPKKYLKSHGLSPTDLSVTLVTPLNPARMSGETGRTVVDWQQAGLILEKEDEDNYYYLINTQGFYSYMALVSTKKETPQGQEETTRQEIIFEKNTTLEGIGEISVRKEYALYTHTRDGKITGEDTIVIIRVRNNAPTTLTDVEVSEHVTPLFISRIREIVFSESPEELEKYSAVLWRIPKLQGYTEQVISYSIKLRVFNEDDVLPPIVRITAPKAQQEDLRPIILLFFLGATAALAYFSEKYTERSTGATSTA